MPPKSLQLPSSTYLCPRCELRRRCARTVWRNLRQQQQQARRFSFDTALRTPSSSARPGYWPSSEKILNHAHAYARLTNRALLRLEGPDVVDFLSGLLPAKLQTISSTRPIFTAFLTARGRILYDAFIFPPPGTSSDGPWYVDVDGEAASPLLQHLKKHKLRSKFKLERVSPEDMGVYYIWPRQAAETPRPEYGGRDPRPQMGVRFLSPTASSTPTLQALESSGEMLSLQDYKIHRILTGHAEGPTELLSQHALPQESNVDFAGGIDFHKGCYLGQELTIRTHHTGVVRKRILPVQLYSGSEPIPSSQGVPMYSTDVQTLHPPHETNISKVRSTGRAGRATGKWLGGVGNVGLALCRLEMMTDINLTAESTIYDPADEYAMIWEEGEADSDGKTTVREVKLKPFIPDWIKDGIQAGFQARIDRGKHRKQEEDDEEGTFE